MKWHCRPASLIWAHVTRTETHGNYDFYGNIPLEHVTNNPIFGHKCIILHVINFPATFGTLETQWLYALHKFVIVLHCKARTSADAEKPYTMRYHPEGGKVSATGCCTAVSYAERVNVLAATQSYSTAIAQHFYQTKNF